MKENDIVQVNERGPIGWHGCLIQVSDVKKWGVIGWVQLPMKGSAFIRLKDGQYDYIGQAVMITQTN